MAKTATVSLTEDVIWMLLQVTGVAILCFAVQKLVDKYKRSRLRLALPQKRTPSSPDQSLGIKESEKTPGTSPWACMGNVTPLQDFDYRTVEPLRVYKFSPKYFLTMGLQKTDINHIIHIDRLYPERLQARQAIINQYPGALDCLPSGIPMLNELYAFLLSTYLPTRYPTIFALSPSTHTVENLVTGNKLPLTPPSDRHETLRILNLNVDEDFMMMAPSPDGDGYSLQSFIWAYPVGFDPQSKLGLKLRDAHGPVPSYKEKLERSMDRYFAALKPGDVKYRTNWALATNGNLCERGEYHLYEGQEPTETEIDLENCFVRCEIQTLFALPESGGKVLSVHLYLYPLREIRDGGLGREMARAVDGFKEGNAPGFWRYKRAPVWGERVKEFLLS